LFSRFEQKKITAGSSIAELEYLKKCQVKGASKLWGKKTPILVIVFVAWFKVQAL